MKEGGSSSPKTPFCRAFWDQLDKPRLPLVSLCEGGEGVDSTSAPQTQPNSLSMADCACWGWIPEEQRQWQLIRRGRYLEFNLLYDRGVRFGLDGQVRVSFPPGMAGKQREERLGLFRCSQADQRRGW